MAFKLNKTSSLSLESPETLFRDMKTKKVHGPLSDQADAWRAYMDKALNEKNVAIQLPTGAGKTLVGLMIGEWRRLKFRDRVVFLCPTRQLVHQVVAEANAKFGLKTHAFTGSKLSYDKDAAAEYQNCERIAVTTYSSLFNSAPYFDDPSVVILDDAHASEQYIANLWSLVIDGSEQKHGGLFEAVVEVVAPTLNPADQKRLTDPDPRLRDRGWVEKIPSPVLHEMSNRLLSVIDSEATEKEHRFAWAAIRDHLDACHMYIGAKAILIRPLLPPTRTHQPFAASRQRIYMSATIGSGGELERITGQSPITNLMSKAADRQTIGRRYFMFPERSLNEQQQHILCGETMKRAGRALVLTPDGVRASEFGDIVRKQTGFDVFDAAAIEKSKTPFIGSQNAVAIVANRYDGIDFPGDECRLMFVEGLPRATNLQELFFVRRLGAVDLLNVRILTRLVQAFGRCTRSDQDYCAVVVRGEELNKYLMTPERRDWLHPELHAELAFGIDQAKGATVADYLENLDTFFAQSDEWVAANAEIVSLRDFMQRKSLPGAEDLQNVAAAELEYQLSLWAKDYESAYGHARAVIAKLTDSSLRGYRALWHYLAGSAAWLMYKDGSKGFDSRAREHFGNAQRAERTVTWLASLAKLADEGDDSVSSFDAETMKLVERIEGMFDELGTLTDFKYDKEEKAIREKIEKNEAKSFEKGHCDLGALLGYDAGNRNDTGSPDPWWVANENLCLIFEDHSDAKADGRLSIEKARQATTHPNWVRANVPLAAGAEVVPIIVTPVRKIDKAATVHMTGVLVWGLDDFRDWSRHALRTLRDLRRDYPGSGDLAWRARAAEALTKASIAPRALLQKLRDAMANGPLVPE
ncbi:DEAD/DEAH box helicase [Steroidobacter flavus]|uniref:DEAD/DEAH box helicase n=1 Tax=Steroidobacter flavus TaxID=1842136 RepID=A0ABV8SXT1_9GAMM